MSDAMVSRIAKGLFAAGTTALGSLSTMLVGKETLHMVTTGQWTTLASLSLGAFGGAFGLAGWSGSLRNGAPPGQVK